MLLDYLALKIAKDAYNLAKSSSGGGGGGGPSTGLGTLTSNGNPNTLGVAGTIGQPCVDISDPNAMQVYYYNGTIWK